MVALLLGLSAIILIVLASLYLISKILKAPKLFWAGVTSFLLITSLLTFIVFSFNEEIDLTFLRRSIPVEKEVEFKNPTDTPFAVSIDGEILEYVDSYEEAVLLAKELENATIVYSDSSNVVWEEIDLPQQAFIQDVPLISQLPELPRGCEVTSLAMFLRSAGIPTDKMTLAEEVVKDPTPYSVKDGIVHFGNPNDGFVGDMYTFDNPGYGVYVGPIYDLANQYLPNRVVNMTGTTFNEVRQSIARGKPVWVVIHTKFGKLPKTSFETWKTPTGEVSITYHQHAVVITGYDQQYVYFNDPLTNERNRQVLSSRFIEAWEQMGSQAITYID